MVQVTVNEGTLEGEVINNAYGGKFYSFKGIPYAQPPVGELRFRVSLLVFWLVQYPIIMNSIIATTTLYLFIDSGKTNHHFS